MILGTWMNLKDMNAQWERPDTKHHVLCDPIYMKHPEEANLKKKEVD